MFFTLTVILCIINAVVTIYTFFVYVRTRMADRTEDPKHTEQQHIERLARLDAKEKQYQAIHFITLFLFIIMGVLICIQLSTKLNTETITIAPEPTNTLFYPPTDLTAQRNIS